ncbi:MAG: hypothetical protein IKG03_01585 [Clostridiales bacterium]|nr:hypothetical protein [Clostridiales bacterium]
MMKKNSDIKPEEKTAPQYGFRKMRPMKVPGAAWFVLGLSFIMAVLLFGLYGMSLSGQDQAGKTLLIYSDGKDISRVSLRNSLAAAGFGFEIIEPDRRSSKPDYVYEIPNEYKNDKVVVCAVGSTAFKVMDDLLGSDKGNIEGYILIDPEYPGNVSLEGYSSDYPSVPCAIFGFDNKASSSSELGGSQMIFEKISGVDTMYGHSTQRGKIFKSKVFVSHNQMRYLSLAQNGTGVTGLLSLPSFQNELAQYLGTTFGRGFSASRIMIWMTGVVFCLFMSVAALALFLFMVPVSVPDKGARELKGRDSLGAIIFLGLSGWIALCGAVMTFIPQTVSFTKYVALYSPVLMIVFMALAQIKLLLSNKVKYTRKDYGLTIFLVSVITGIVELMILVAASLNLTNVEDTLKNDANPIAALIVFVLMSVSAAALILADKKSRFSGQGASAYFGSPMYFIEALLPPAVLLVMGLIQENAELIRASLTGVAVGVIPFGCAMPIKRISDFYEITGLLFGLVAALIVLTAG